VDAAGIYWRANYGEISEILQFRVGPVGSAFWTETFPANQLTDLITILNGTGAASVGQVVTGTYLQARRIGGTDDIISIEPLSPFFPPYLMQLRNIERPDLISVLVTLQAMVAEGSSEPDDWDFNKAPDIPMDAIPNYLHPEQLSATYGGVGGQRPGGYMAVLSDSTGRGVYSGDSEPGIYDGALITVAVSGDSWITWAQSLSAGRVLKARNASVIGDTIAEMDARVVADIVNAPMEISACIVISGYNDADLSVTPAAYMASLRSIVAKLRDAGIVPILGTPLPTANNAAVAGLLVQYALQVRQYGAEQGIVVLDFQNWAMDSATGGLRTEVGTGGDGVHPGAAGQKWLGQRVADTLAALLPLSASSLVTSPLDVSNIAPNPLFAGTVVGGLAPSVYIYGAAQAGVTPTVATDSLVPGKVQRVTHAGSTLEQVYAQRVTRAGNWAHGDLLEVSGIITASGIAASVGIEWDAHPFGTKPINLTQNATRGYYCTRTTIPASTGYPDSFDVMFKSGPGTGVAEFGQLSIRNLTALGLA
jgi:lysophospholipase L1-like esterase